MQQYLTMRRDGGMLAHDMSLGNTVKYISLIYYDPHTI